MGRSSKPGEDTVKRTLGRDLRDLDDHMMLVDEALHKVMLGYQAYTKPLSGELRLLLCNSDKAALLWRVANSLGLGGDIKPARQEIRRRRVGNSASTRFTQEELIKMAAQQVGSAHEDEDVEREIVHLEQTRIGHLSALAWILTGAARIALQVGHELLVRAEFAVGFQRRWYPRAPVTALASPHALRPGHPDDFEDDGLLRLEQGTIEFWAQHADPDWQTNDTAYDFGAVGDASIALSACKTADGQLEMVAHGISDHPVFVVTPLSPTVCQMIMIAATWNIGEITFYLNGHPIRTYKRLGPEMATATRPDVDWAISVESVIVGEIREVRMSLSAFSNAWILTSYNNISSPEAFATWGAVQTIEPMDRSV